MSSTNKTPNLELSQFLANDIPSWLGDYNGDMLKIDTAVQSANATASAASGTATTASNQAQNALNVANSAETRSTNNAEDITDLKGALTNSNFSVTTLANNVTEAHNIITASDYIARVSLYFDFSANPTNGTVVNEYTRIPLCSVSGNLFKISASTLSDDTAKIYLTTMMRLYVDGTINANAVSCYYDGANTIFFATITTSYLSKQISIIWGNTTVLFTGNFIPDVLEE